MNESHEFPYPYPYYDEKTGKVNCQVCGKPFLVISPRHLMKHDMKMAEYKLRFPDAPLSNEEFSVRGLYGKNKDMFKEAEVEVEEVLIDDVIIEEPEEDEIIVEELELAKKLPVHSVDKVQAMKNSVHNHLMMIFTNVKANYLIEDKWLNGQLKYSYISDFADPILRIVFFFPKTFWHNQDAFPDPHRDRRLQEDGWKVVTINANPPTIKAIEDATKDLF